MLAPELHQKRVAGGRPGRAMAAAPSFEIGVLDIFGFENFTTNSFEQVRTVFFLTREKSGCLFAYFVSCCRLLAQRQVG